MFVNGQSVFDNYTLDHTPSYLVQSKSKFMYMHVDHPSSSGVKKESSFRISSKNKRTPLRTTNVVKVTLLLYISLIGFFFQLPFFFFFFFFCNSSVLTIKQYFSSRFLMHLCANNIFAFTTKLESDI